MKTFIKTIAIVASFAALNANATIELSHTDTTSFDVGGSIAAECKINSTQAAGATSLDLASSSAQEVASVELWCNTGQSTARTTYSSFNNGVLSNGTHASQDIAYLIDIAETDSGLGLDLTNPQTVSQSSSTGVNGASTSRTVSIKPIITGFEYEGSYSDTITVTVALN